MRIVTFNIAAARYAPIEEIATFIDALEPDVALIQEVDRFKSRSNGVDQHAILTRLLGSAQAYFSPSRGNAAIGYYGTSVYFRQPFAEKISRHNLTVVGDRESRFAIEAQLTQEASKLFGVDLISNIHLSVNLAIAELQLKKLLQRYEGLSSFVIGGDFNLGPDALERIGFPDEDKTPTAGVPQRRFKIDRFFVKTPLNYHSHTVPSGHLSDHDAVLLES